MVWQEAQSDWNIQKTEAIEIEKMTSRELDRKQEERNIQISNPILFKLQVQSHKNIIEKD